jgi:hypothetical protein
VEQSGRSPPKPTADAQSPNPQRKRVALAALDALRLLLIGIAVKGEELVTLVNPCRSVLDRPARDVDREVIARIVLPGDACSNAPRPQHATNESAFLFVRCARPRSQQPP